MGQQLSLDKDKIRFLLLEGVHQTALDTLSSAGYSNIEYLKTALDVLVPTKWTWMPR